MEKFSKWRDPSTGIQPFLPSTSQSTPISLILMPLSAVILLVRVVLLLAAVLLNVILVGPLSALGIRPLAYLLNAVVTRTALATMGYYWIDVETVSAKRGKAGVSQSLPTSAKKGDLILSNWTGYIDVLILSFLHHPTFLLPVFTTPPPAPDSFGRSTGTGSASILPPTSTSTCAGYIALTAGQVIARTGSLPPTVDEVGDARVYPTLAEARRASSGPVVLFPEGTTSNGRAVLRFGEGVLAEDVGKQDGVTWVKFIKHAPATPMLPGAVCPLPWWQSHLRSFLLTLPLPRQASVRTLHPSAAPSSPSFLPSEILAAQPGGLGAVRNENAWRDACAIVLAETGRVRRVPGMGWIEKSSFLDYYVKARR